MSALHFAATVVAVLATQQGTPIQRAARYSAERDGDAVLVFRHDSLVLEDYQNGYNGREQHGLASGTKAFACALVALAVSNRFFQLDDPVSRTLPDFRSDTVKARVTWRQLLSLTSGLGPDITTPQDYAASTRLPLASRPGEQFAYGGAAFHVLTVLFATKGIDPAALLDHEILAPLGGGESEWVRDATGRPNLASGAALTARAWGMFGLVLLHRGMWRGRQLVPAAGIAACLRGSDANPWFGLGLWLNAREPRTPPPAGVTRVGLTDRRLYATDLPSDIFLAAGTAGQRLYVVPTASLVIVRFGHNTGPQFKDDEFLRLALGKN